MRWALLLLGLFAGPALAETVRVDGLGAPVEITTDRWGVPHIGAQSQADAFFGQGYAAASNRLWQMDIARRRMLGRMAVAFGPDFLPLDVAARTLLFRGDLAAEWAVQYPPAVPLARAWVAGVNARVAEVLANPALLPPEFAAMDMLPEAWAADDLMQMRRSGPPNVRGEMRRAVLACAGALELDGLAQKLEPPHPLVLPAGLDPCALRPEMLAVLDRYGGPSPWPRSRRAGALGAAGTAVALGEVDDLDSRQGSNAWVVAPGRSGSGRALLATDPHLPVSVPGPQFIVHLKAPGLDAIGSGWVFRPGTQGGHNDRVARGRTDFQMDQEDLVLLELDEAGTAYRVPGGWAPITRVTERIPVRDAAAAEVTVAGTALGPVIFQDQAAHRALVLRSAQLQSGPSTALEYIGVTLARNWAEHQAALRYVSWGSNYFYADVEGNIGWQTGGRMPRRRGHDGLLPVPAAGGFDWDGFLPVEEMVGEFNPPRGWIASGNQMPFPNAWPAARRTSWEWIPDDRYRRMSEVLAVQVPHDHAAALALQQDVLSLRARALLPVLAALPNLPAEAALLRAWDGRMTADSEAAAIFAFWWSGLAEAVRLAMVPAPLRATLPALHPQVMLALVTGEDPRLGEARLALVGQALAGAAARWRALPAEGRRWGDLHRVDLRHVLGALLPEAHVLGGRSGGDGATLMARWWQSAARPQATGGASFRMVVEPGDWERARASNLPGQSGDPRSPHYADLYPMWLAGETFPLAYGAAAVAAVAESTLTLLPK